MASLFKIPTPTEIISFLARQAVLWSIDKQRFTQRSAQKTAILRFLENRCRDSPSHRHQPLVSIYCR